MNNKFAQICFRAMSGNPKDIKEFKENLSKYQEKLLDKDEQSEDNLKKFNDFAEIFYKTSHTSFAPICAFIGGMVA